MKLKVAATRTLPQSLIAAFNSSDTAGRFLDNVVDNHLHVPRSALGPATHFVQETDLTVDVFDDAGVNVAFTMVSANRFRSAEDFWQALKAVERIYRELIEVHVPVGQRVQLFCALALDGEIEGPDGIRTRLIETQPVWIDGRLVQT